MHRSIGRLLSAASLALIFATGAGAMSGAGAAATAPSQVSFADTGAPQNWVVPAGITKIATKVCGASGEFVGSGHNLFAGKPGFGGCVSAVLAVTPGETLIVRVGGSHKAGIDHSYNGGGTSICTGDTYCGGDGGGASDVRQGGDALSNRVLVGGGGGGGGASLGLPGGRGGSGGNGRDGFNGDQGGQGQSQPYNLVRADGGPGGTLTGPGKAGCGVNGNPPTRTCPAFRYNADNISGDPGKGPDGGDARFAFQATGGGGGGGYFGGAGGAGSYSKNTTGTTGGGGGSSYSDPKVTTQVRLSEQTDTQWMRDLNDGSDHPSMGEPGRVEFSWPVPDAVIPKPNEPQITSLTVNPNAPGAVNAGFDLGPIFNTAVAPGQTPVKIVTSLEYATSPKGPWLALSFPTPGDPRAKVTGSFSLTHLTDGTSLVEGSTLWVYLRDSGPGGQASARPVKVALPKDYGFVNPSATTTTLSTTPTIPTTVPSSGGCSVRYPSIHVGLGAPVNVVPVGAASADRFSLAGGVLPSGLSLLPNGQVSGQANVPTSGPVAVRVLKNGVACAFVTIDVAPASALHYPPSVTLRPGTSLSVSPTPVPGATYFIVSAPPGVTVAPSTGVVTWSVPTTAKGTTAIAIGRTIGTTTATSVISVTATVTAPSLAAPTGTTTTTIPRTQLVGINQTGSCVASPTEIYPNVISSSGSTVTVAPNVTGLGTPTSFSLTSGSLPQGLVLDGAVGVIAGTPSYLPGSSSTATIAISFTDHTVRLATFHLLALPSPLRLNYPVHVAAAVGYDTHINPQAFGLSKGTRFAVACGVLPPGLELDYSTGQIVGQPTEAVNSPAPVVIRAIDPVRGAVDASLIVTVGEPTPTVVLPTVAYGTNGEAFSLRPTLGDLDPGSTFKIISGTLPEGLALNHHTGAIKGTPTKETSGQRVTVAAVQPEGQPSVAASVSLIIGHADTADASSFPWWWLLLGGLLILAVVVLILSRRSASPKSA